MRQPVKLWQQAHEEHPHDRDAQHARYLELMHAEGRAVEPTPPPPPKGTYPCPECGWPLLMVFEPRSLQLVGGDYVVRVRLDRPSLEHVERHE